MHKTLSLGYTCAETEDCKKKIFLAAKNGGHTPGGYTLLGIAETGGGGGGGVRDSQKSVCLPLPDISFGGLPTLDVG